MTLFFKREKAPLYLSYALEWGMAIPFYYKADNTQQTNSTMTKNRTSDQMRYTLLPNLLSHMPPHLKRKL